jgi:tricorn protease
VPASLPTRPVAGAEPGPDGSGDGGAGYLRFPTIAGDLVAFVTEDDLWTVPAAGGMARRLTANLSAVTRPVLSPDGRWLAFSSQDEHNPEVWSMPARGGPAERLTWLGADATPRGFTPDGRVLFITTARQPFSTLWHPWAVPPEGGVAEPLPYGPARDVAFGPRGEVVLGRNTADPARWKRYRGGTVGRLWVDRAGRGTFQPLLPELEGNLASPMWVGTRVAFLSDHEGVGNLYSCRPDGTDLRRHTDHDDYYARWAATDGRRVVYQCGADIWLWEPGQDAAHRVPVELGSPRVQRRRRFVPASANLAELDVHPAGHSVALVARGKPFTMPLWEEAVRQLGEPQGVRYRLPVWLGDGSALALVSDASAEDGLEVHQAEEGGARALAVTGLGRVVDLAPSPDGARLAVANHRHELMVVEVADGTSRPLDHSPGGELDGLAWSPDGKYLAYSCAMTRHTRSIKVVEVVSGESHAITEPQFRDRCPSWDPSGRHLFFLSLRTFDPVYDSVVFDLGFPRGDRPYAVTLRADLPSPFVPRPKGLRPDGGQGGESPPQGPGADERSGGEVAPGAADTEPPADRGSPEVVIDFEGIGSRIVAFPVPEGRYSQVLAIEAKVLLVSHPIEGTLSKGWSDTDAEPTGSLEVYDLTELRHEVLAEGVTEVAVSADKTTMVYRSGNHLRAVAAGQKPPEDDQDDEAPGRKNGWLDLSRVRVSVEPGAEWRQMLAEAWRLQRDHFWVADMSGVDWRRVLERYLPLVERVATRLEFSDLVWEMQGELGTSHAYELGGDYRPVPPYAMGHLGADLELDPGSGRWRVAHLVSGDSWDPSEASPLLAPGIGVAPGDTILSVNGQRVGPDLTPAMLLVNQAGLTVELTVGDPSGQHPRRVVVTTLTDEQPLRYREWVVANRDRVHRETAGRVGYVHVPDMGPTGYAEFHRGYVSEVEKDALVIDLRHNGGGHVSPLLLEKLGRRRIGWEVSRWSTPEPYPSYSPAGPLVLVTNEWAGSDGDIFTHSFELLGLGPVVGTRTWGGVVGISPSYRLVDGSLTTQPEYAFWFVDAGWAVENRGVEPDHLVEVRPEDAAAGRDAQLDEALALALELLEDHQAPHPDQVSRPTRAFGTLPPRAKDGASRARVPAKAATSRARAAGSAPRAAARRTRPGTTSGSGGQR